MYISVSQENKLKNKRNIYSRSVPGLVVALVASVAAMGLRAAEPAQARLLVNIVVDGLEGEYLDLLREHFGDGGFRRLERDGAVILNADYGTGLDAAASTALLMSGASPSLNGIGSAYSYDRESLRVKDIYADAEVLGNFTTQGYSPRALRVSNISDEARIASGGTSVVYSVAATPAVAISLAGHAANSALWLDTKTGNWASSTFYKEMPTAIATRNRTQPLNMRMDTMSWVPSHDIATYPALPDHLRRYPFRYVFPRSNTSRFEMFCSSPLINREVNTVASDLLSTLKVGQHEGVTDVLNLSYTIAPYNYGRNPDARVELMDSYIKLDATLQQLFADIDRRVGLGNTVVMLAATPPRRQSRRDDEQWGIPFGEFSTRKAISLLNIYLMAVYGNGDYVSAYHNRQFYLNHKLISEKSLDQSEVREKAAAFLARMTGIDRVHTIDEIIAGHAGEKPEVLRRNTVSSASGDIIVSVAPGYELVDDFNQMPSSERVPLAERSAATTAPVFIMAPGIASQTIGEVVDARAIAPAVCRILRIRSPNGASEAPLHLLKK